MNNSIENKTNEQGFSFDYQQKSDKPSAPFKISDARAKYYFDLCNQKGITPVNIYEVTSQEEYGVELEKVRSHRPASEAQINLIKQKVENLNQLGMNIEVDYSQLTGGKDGTASILASKLIEKEKEFSDIMPMTRPQLETLVKWFFCPDIPFEEFEITKHVDLGNGMWRLMTPNEFAHEINSKMKKKDASYFIDKYRGDFYTWSKTRIRPEQAKLIRQLEDRFTSNNSSVLESAVTFGGELLTIKTGKHEAPIVEYVKMEEYQLLQLSVEDASHLISMMKAELQNKSLYRFGEVNDGSQTFEGLRHHKTSKASSLEEELKDLVRIAYKMEAVAGYKLPELHDAIDEAIVDNSNDWSEKKDIIRNTMLELIADDAISLQGFGDLFNGNETAMNILMKIEG